MVAMATGLNYDNNHNMILAKSPKVWRKADKNSRSGEQNQIYDGVTPFFFLGLTQHTFFTK